MNENLTIELPIRFVHELSQAETLNSILATVARWSRTVFTAERASITLASTLEGKPSHLKLIALEGNNAIPRDMPIPIEGTMVGRVFRNRRSEICRDTSRSTDLDCLMLAERGMKSCLDVPLLSGATCFGTMNLGHSQEDAFTDIDRRRLEAMAQWVASSIRIHHQHELVLEASRSKSTFLAAASHDLRQPVHALGLFVGALRGAKLRGQSRDIVDQMETSIAGLEELFNALLDVSRLDAGIVEVQPRVFRLGPLIDRICLDYEREAKDKGLRFVRVPTSAVIESDPVLFERILRNLIANAVRHTRSGRILVGCRRSAGSVRLQVFDTGPGISKADQERIFDEFVQLGNSERDRTKGLGLGLAIVRRLTGLLSCPLILNSELDRGSCFEIRIQEHTEPFEEVEVAPLDVSSLFKKGAILVVDNEPSIRQAMEALLSRWGHRVITVASGDEAMMRLSEPGCSPDLILCDYRLREQETGVMVIERIRRELKKDLPAILISGDTAPDRLAESHALDATLLPKPVPYGALRTAINSALLSSESRTAVQSRNE